MPRKRSREEYLTEIREWYDRHACDRDHVAPRIATAYVGYLLGIIDGREQAVEAEVATPSEKRQGATQNDRRSDGESAPQTTRESSS
jgi:hypothetical protein